MNPDAISYQFNFASTDKILKHLEECDQLFIPPLSETINLNAYSKKIKTYADTFEAWANNRLIGFIAVYYNDTQPKTAYITNVSVLSDFLGMKIADNLLKKVETKINELDVSAIELEVDKNNINAINLYSKYNFEKSHLSGNKYKMKKVINDK